MFANGPIPTLGEINSNKKVLHHQQTKHGEIWINEVEAQGAIIHDGSKPSTKFALYGKCRHFMRDNLRHKELSVYVIYNMFWHKPKILQLFFAVKIFCEKY